LWPKQFVSCRWRLPCLKRAMARRTSENTLYRVAALIAAVSLAAAAGEAFVASGPSAPYALRSPSHANVQVPVSTARVQSSTSAPWWKAGASIALLSMAAVGLRTKPRAAKTHVVRLACSSIPEAPVVREVAMPAQEMPMVVNLIDMDSPPQMSVATAPAVPTLEDHVEVSATQAAATFTGPTAARFIGGSRFRSSRARHAARFGRSARRAVGQRLVEGPTKVVLPTSFDVSRLRTQIQNGLRIPQSLRCGRRGARALHVCGAKTRGSMIEVEHVLQQAYLSFRTSNRQDALVLPWTSSAKLETIGTVRRCGGGAMRSSGRGWRRWGLRSTSGPGCALQML